MNLILSMAAFALASSISPGPVNLVALSAGAQYGLRASMRHVSGATCGFTALLLLTGLGLHELLERYGFLAQLIRWGGIGFLLFMAYQLATDDGRLGAADAHKRPSFLYGAGMQWLNPKAWLASLAGMGLYAADGEAALVWQFTLIYFVVCYASLACWAVAGTFLRHYLQQASRVRSFNRVMAALLAASAACLLLG